jgi:hypothetical protein
MVKLLAECSKCDSPVIDSLETEIEQHGKVKTGSYTNGRWMCHSCIENDEGKNKIGKRVDDSSSAHIDKCETLGLANDSPLLVPLFQCYLIP